ncbi:MAG: DUF1294 domain-containing protein [Actinomycetota bacterium]
MEPQPPWPVFTLMAVVAIVLMAVRFRRWRRGRRNRERRRMRPRFAMSGTRATSTFLSVGTAVAVAWWATDRWALSVLAAWFVGVNVAALAWFGLDKAASMISVRRVPESTLHTMAALGGSPGAVVGRDLFKHKTIKPSFNTVLWRVISVQILLVLAWFYVSNGSS